MAAENIIYVVVLVLLVGAMAGLYIYGRKKGNKTPVRTPQAAEPVKTTESDKKMNIKGLFNTLGTKQGESVQEHAPTEHLVDLCDMYPGLYGGEDAIFRTDGGDLVCLLKLTPIYLTTGADPMSLSSGFCEAIKNMPEKSTYQFVQMPVPTRVEGMTDRYAMYANNWLQEYKDAEVAGDEAAMKTMQMRYFMAFQIGADILENGGVAPLRESLLVLRHSTTGLIGKLTEKALEDHLNKFRVTIAQTITLFEAHRIRLSAINKVDALEILWYAYNPDQGAMAMIEMAGQRYAELVNEGRSDIPMTSAMSQEKIKAVLENPAGELKSALSPFSAYEDEHKVIFSNKKAVHFYYVNDFKANIPAIGKLYGQDNKFYTKLLLSFYVSAPSADAVAFQTRKAETALKATEAVRERLGQMGSYKKEEQIAAIEQSRRGAETEKDVPKWIGMYIGVVSDMEESETDRREIESLMNACGIQYVPATWMAMSVWQTMLPIGQRKHRSAEDRNVFARNIAPLNPITAQSFFDPSGEFCGYSVVSAAKWMPVAVQRKRGTPIVPSDAIVGAPGSGKSFLSKYQLIDWVIRGHRAFVIDPKLEFGEITRHLGGTVTAGLGTKGFNLFQFSPLPQHINENVALQLAKLMFDDNLSALLTLYVLTSGGNRTLSGVERNLLTKALLKAMENKDMDSKDPRTWRTNTVFLRDVYEVLNREMRVEAPDEISLICSTLEQYATPTGQYFHTYNTAVDIDLSNQLNTMQFGMSQFSTGETGEKSLAYNFALRMAIQHAVYSFFTDPVVRPYHIIIDEASQMLVTGMLVSSVVKILSLLPAYGISAHLNFQSFDAIIECDRLLGNSGSVDSTNSLISTIPAYWLFGQRPASARLAVQSLMLPEYNANIIANHQVTRDYSSCTVVFPGANLQLPLIVKAPEALKPMFTTQTEDMKRLATNELAGGNR